MYIHILYVYALVIYSTLAILTANQATTPLLLQPSFFTIMQLKNNNKAVVMPELQYL